MLVKWWCIADLYVTRVAALNNCKQKGQCERKTRYLTARR
nr:MAG TPA: hypothetical protein [Caudoviricetes sp.]